MPISNFPNAPLGPSTNIRTAEPKWVTNSALGLLEQELVLANLVYRDAAFDFQGSIGEAVNIKRPTRSIGTYDVTPFIHSDYVGAGTSNMDPNLKTRPDATTRSGWVPDHIEETYIQVKLDTKRGNQVDISDEMLDFDIDSFAAEVIQPAVRGMAEYFEWRLARDIQAFFGPQTDPADERVVSVKATLSPGNTADDMRANALAVRTAIIDARKAANAMAMPQNGRFLLCTPEVEAILLKDPDFQRVDFTGTSEALRNAVIGKLYGLWIVTSNELAAHTEEGLAMYLWHPTALVLCTKAPAVPRGAIFGAGASANGVAVRWMMDYDPDKQQDRSRLDVYLGTNMITEDKRYVEDMKLRLPKLARGVTIPNAFDVMRCVRIDLEFNPSP